MGWSVELTAEAQADFEQIVLYIAGKSPAAAIRFGDRLIDLIFSLDQLPHRGSPVGQRPALRKLTYRYVLIIYRIDQARRRVDIVRLWDGRRDPSSD